MAFIDFRKAFDHIWRPALYLKILDKGITGQVYSLIKNMYQENIKNKRTHF